MVLKRLRRGLDRFLAVLDGEGVALFQAIVYAHIVAAGAYGFVAGTPQAVEQSMGPLLNAVWLWLCAGAAVCLAGKMMKGQAAYAGMLLQLTGDLVVLCVLAVYITATIDGSWWGQALFAVFIVASIAECVLLLVMRDVRRIIQVEQQARQ